MKIIKKTIKRITYDISWYTLMFIADKCNKGASSLTTWYFDAK